MSKESAMQRYVASVEAIAEHVRANKPIFDAHRHLINAQIDAENALRDAVAESGTGISWGGYDVTCTPQEQTIFDENRILARLGISKEQAVSEGIITINKRPPRITIGRPREAAGI